MGDCNGFEHPQLVIGYVATQDVSDVPGQEQI